MKVQRYVRHNPQRAVEDLTPSSILDFEISNELKFYDDKVERLAEEVHILNRVVGALLDELPEDAVRKALRSSIYGVFIDDTDTDDSGE